MSEEITQHVPPITSRAARLQILFAAAVEMPAGARSRFLETQCDGDDSLAAEVLRLVDVDAQLAGKTARPVAPIVSALLDDDAATHRSRVGPFELRRELGRGGMGSVHLGVRVDGVVEQSVAIKFVRRELVDPASLKRFRLERQLLAQLDHPYIARLLDAAELPDGSPYYVMEYVDGKPITEYCDDARLDLRARIALVRMVCEAVAEAHHELIVHRDLKPSNILVGAGGTPKLLDFGIAKALDPDAVDALAEHTGTAHRYFSPHYAAPEQLAGKAVGVACDVYALGLLLHELLVGARPFDFTGLSAAQVERLVMDTPPPAPSAALEKRGGENGPIRARALRGDLDGIVMRCLRKSPNERYGSVEQLDAELASYLAGRPVQARGGQGWYRLQKFVRRNALGVAAGAIIAIALVGGVLAVAWQARFAHQRAAELAQVAQFQAEMLRQATPAQAGKLLSDDVLERYAAEVRRDGLAGADAERENAEFARRWKRVNATDAARNLLDESVLKPAAEAAAEKFKAQPRVDAELSQTLANLYRQMSLYDAAAPLQERALALRRKTGGELDPDTIASMIERAQLMNERGQTLEAEREFRDVLARSRRVFGADHPDTLDAVNRLANHLRFEGKLDEAEPLAREAMEGRERVLGPDHIDTLTSIGNLGFVLRGLGRLDEAEPYLRTALERRRRVLGDDHRLTVVSLNNLGLLLLDMTRYDEAEPLAREVLERRKRILGDTHSDTLLAMSSLSFSLRELGKPAEAEALARQAFEGLRATVGPRHPSTLFARVALGRALQDEGRLDEADVCLQEVYDTRLALFGPEHGDTVRTLVLLGMLRVAQNRPADAIALLEPSDATIRKALGSTVDYKVRYALALGRAHLALGELDAAEPRLNEAQRTLDGAKSPDRRILRDTLQARVALFEAHHDPRAIPTRARLDALR